MSLSRQITGIPACIARPMTPVSGARSLGATMRRLGASRIDVSIWLICFALSCWASMITSFTSGCLSQSRCISAFWAAR